ncbi:MAG TPA: hypothetical protein VE987_04600 [Polyangiaceae bacterium]|nr:hypothetical protein [Polyangiaceae bacterium]
MSHRVTRLRSALSFSVAPLLAGFFAVACSAGPGGESSASSSQALSGPGALHSNVTRGSWHPQVGGDHGKWDDERACHPAPLGLCPLFDSDFGIGNGGPACAHVTTPSCPDRVDTWDDLIVFDFAIAVTGDCRFGQWAPPLLTDQDVVNYLNDLLAFTLRFFGCPEQGTTGRLTFGLIPSALQGDHFTTADLDALADTYAAAVAQALSDSGAPPLSADQMNAINMKLNRLAHHVPGTVRSNAFTFSTCPPGSANLTADTTPDDDSDCQ